MNIPSKDVVGFVMREVLNKSMVRSQNELAEFLNKRFRKNTGYSVSGSRARMIAIQTPGIRVRIITRKGPVPKRCPVCSSAVRRTHTRNLRGKKMLHTLSCAKCPFRGSGGKWMPARYEFRG